MHPRTSTPLKLLIALAAAIFIIGLAGLSYFRISGYPPRATSSISSGIYGKATVGPTCPVQKEGEVCSRPYQGEIVVKAGDRTREVTRFKTDGNGQFKVKLAPGKYYLVNTPKEMFPFLKETFIEVKPNIFTEVNFGLDTGIR